MRNDLSDITLIVDRSGSMAQIQRDAEGGVNAFIADQKAKPGDATFSLLHFDTDYEFVQKAVPIRDAREYHLEPRGATALLDAVGRAISEIGSRLDTMREEDRPGLVVVVIVTDGEENSSKEYTKARVKEMIEHQQTKYGWKFTYLGANQDAFAEAGSIGIHSASVANFSLHNSGAAYKCASLNVSRMRSATAGGFTATSCYTSQERSEMESE